MASRRRLSPTKLAIAEVKQLEIESKLTRMKVSEAAKDLQAYIEAHQEEDYLVKGFENTNTNGGQSRPNPNAKKNPFVKKKMNYCKLL